MSDAFTLAHSSNIERDVKNMLMQLHECLKFIGPFNQQTGNATDGLSKSTFSSSLSNLSSVQVLDVLEKYLASNVFYFGPSYSANNKKKKKS